VYVVAITVTVAGPRLVLNPIRVFRSSFGGETLYQNPNYQSPNEVIFRLVFLMFVVLLYTVYIVHTLYRVGQKSFGLLLITYQRLVIERHVMCDKFWNFVQKKCITCILVCLNTFCLFCMNLHLSWNYAELWP